jgi:PAS domain S-box-containing protein
LGKSSNLNLDLRRKVAELETLLEVLPIGIGIAEDSECRVIRTNPSLAAMLKLPRGSNASLTAVADQRPTTFKVLSGGLEVPADELPLQVAASTGRAVRDLELDVVFSDGHTIRLWESASPLFDEQGRPRGSVGAFVDVTERKKQDDIRGSWIQRLSESERRFRHMADHAPVLIWIADTEKKGTWFNAPWLEFTGRTLDKELGHGWTENIHPDDLERTLQTYYAAFDARESFTMDFRCRRADGQYRWLADSGTPLYGQADEFTGYIGSCIDVTDRIAAHEERQLLVVQLMQRSSELAVLSKATQDVNQVLDIDSILSTLVAAALQMTGAEGGMASRVEADSLHFTQYHRRGERTAIDLGFRSNDPSGVPNWIMHHRKPYLCDDAFRDEVVRPDVRSAFQVHNLIAVPIFGRDDRLLGVLELHNKPAPEQFTKHDVEKLQGLAAGAAIALENARLLHQVREADRRKDEFLAMLAHELRNPLAPVRSAIDLLRLDDDRDEHLQGLFEIMDRQISHMGRLIDDLLDVSRITRGRISLQKKELDLAALITTVVADHRQVTADAGLTLTAEIASEPMWIFGDETRLAQVIDNLFGNSVKFTERGGKLEVTLGLGSEPGEAELSIRDTGIGIGAEDLPRIFNAFAQADHSLDRKRGGLGLGLALAKGIIELHGGRIQAASPGLGKGSIFTLHLPLIPKPEPVEPDISMRVVPKTSLRVLIVEDNRDAADTLRMLLKAHGYDVGVAYSGTEGVEAAKLLKPDVVLCDIGLPGMDGYSVAATLRAQPGSEGLRLIALSGYGREEDRKRAFEAGFDDHMTKPAEIDKVLAKLADLGGAGRLSPDAVGR